jgi:hypothetical protein
MTNVMHMILSIYFSHLKEKYCEEYMAQYKRRDTGTPDGIMNCTPYIRHVKHAALCKHTCGPHKERRCQASGQNTKNY